MGQLIDSSVFIDLERKGLGLELLTKESGEEPLALATITASELLTGLYRAASQDRRLQRAEFFESISELLTVEPFDLQVARTHAQLWAELATSGQLIGAHDLIIAATALAHGHSLLTHNLREFERVPGLTVRQPTW